jgi:hypothetical protein
MAKRPKMPRTQGQRALLAKDVATPSQEGYGPFTTAAPVDSSLPPPERVRQAMLNAAAVHSHFEWVAGFENEYLDQREELEKEYQRARKRDGKFARSPWEQHAKALAELAEQKRRWAVRLQVIAAQRELDFIWREAGGGTCPVPRWDDKYTPVLDRATLHRIVQAAHPEITENAARWFREKVEPVVDVEQLPGERESVRVNIRMLRDAFPNVEEASLLAPLRAKNRARRENSDVALAAKPAHRRATHTK